MRSILPNLSLIFTVSFAICDGSQTGRRLGLIVGLLQDIIFFKYIGFYGLIFYLLGHFAGEVSERFSNDHFLFSMAVILGADAIYCLVSCFFLKILGGDLRFKAFLLETMLPEICYTGLVAMPLFALNQLLSRGLKAMEASIRASIDKRRNRL